MSYHRLDHPDVKRSYYYINIIVCEQFITGLDPEVLFTEGALKANGLNRVAQAARGGGMHFKPFPSPFFHIL